MWLPDRIVWMGDALIWFINNGMDGLSAMMWSMAYTYIDWIEGAIPLIPLGPEG